MDRSEIVLSKGGAGGGGGNTGKGSDGFIDRSKVRILLCDSDSRSLEEVFTLLCKCSYQVTSVRSPRQVIGALNAEGPDIDIILSELDLPMTKGFKMLKYITRDKDLQRIPVIMMSAQDEVSVVVKCLRLGAADYLVKPLRTNELLNLWTHMWRRRQMLGLAEKNIVNYDFDPVASDPSDANTNSTTLFSDDTDDKYRKSANPEMCVSTHQEDDNAAPVAASEETAPTGRQPDLSGFSHQQMGHVFSGPKKSQLKIGECSAFFTYVKSGLLKNDAQVAVCVDGNTTDNLRIEKKLRCGQVDSDPQGLVIKEAQENHSRGDDVRNSSNVPDSFPVERSSSPPLTPYFSQQRNSNIEEFSQVHRQLINDTQHDFSSFNGHMPYPYYIPGVMNQVMMSTTSMYQKNLQHLQNNGTPTSLHQNIHIPHCPPHVPGIASFPYYPVSVCLQPGQMPSTHPWLPYGSSSSTDGKLSRVDRREAALLKFRQKRKERCFDKKIRYVNRKRLAEKRPRVKGQFVRKLNGLNVDLNGQPSSADFEYDEEDEEEEDRATRDSSPEDDVAAFL